MLGRHSSCFNRVFVVEVGGLVCVREGVSRRGASLIVRWAENAVPLHFVELSGQDSGDIVG